MERAPNPPPATPDERRDLALRKLLGLIMKHPWSAREAMRRIEPSLTQFVDELNSAKRASVRRTRILVNIARDMLLDPQGMEAASDVEIDPNNLPEGMDEFAVRTRRVLRKWEADSFRELGHFDTHVKHDLDLLRGHLQNAKDQKFDLNSNSAVDAYTFALSKVWSQGKYSQEHFAAELDLDKVVNSFATRETALIHQLRDEIERNSKKPRSREEWWRVTLLILFAFDEHFDGTEVDIGSPLVWRRTMADTFEAPGRSQIKLLAVAGSATTEGDRTAVILPLLEQAESQLDWDGPPSPVRRWDMGESNESGENDAPSGESQQNKHPPSPDLSPA